MQGFLDNEEYIYKALNNEANILSHKACEKTCKTLNTVFDSRNLDSYLAVLAKTEMKTTMKEASVIYR